jgi:DNA mismatch repair protein MLH3
VSIAERCKEEPKLLIELLRKEVWKLEEQGATMAGGNLPALPPTSSHGWISQFHGCPEGILDLLNSRACRSKQTRSQSYSLNF